MALLELNFLAADPAASTGGAGLLPLGAPDLVDLPGYVLPFPVQIIGIIGQANPATGDTVALQCNIAAAGKAGPSVVLPHVAAAPSAGSWIGGALDAIQVAAGTLIQVFYTTTTGGTYTVNDIMAKLLVQTPTGSSVAANF